MANITIYTGGKNPDPEYLDDVEAIECKVAVNRAIRLWNTGEKSVNVPDELIGKVTRTLDCAKEAVESDLPILDISHVTQWRSEVSQTVPADDMPIVGYTEWYEDPSDSGKNECELVYIFDPKENCEVVVRGYPKDENDALVGIDSNRVVFEVLDLNADESDVLEVEVLKKKSLTRT